MDLQQDPREYGVSQAQSLIVTGSSVEELVIRDALRLPGVGVSVLVVSVLFTLWRRAIRRPPNDR